MSLAFLWGIRMDRYYGFDLGDAESAVTYLKKNEQMEPKVVPVRIVITGLTLVTRKARSHI